MNWKTVQLTHMEISVKDDVYTKPEFHTTIRPNLQHFFHQARIPGVYNDSFTNERNLEIMGRNFYDYLEFLYEKYGEDVFKTKDEYDNLVAMCKASDMQDGVLAVSIIEQRLSEALLKEEENGIKV